MFSLLSVNGGNTMDWLVRVYHIWHTEVGKMSPQDSPATRISDVILVPPVRKAVGKS